MKMKGIVISMLLLLIGSICAEVSAQENIEAVIRKCESMESVNMTVVRNRDPKTKKLQQTITSISIKNNPALVNELVAALKKDEPNATQAIDRKKNGKIVPQYYSFGSISYSFSLKEDGNASISVIDSRSQ